MVNFDAGFISKSAPISLYIQNQEQTNNIINKKKNKTKKNKIKKKKNMAGGGTEAFPDLGEHCQNPDCKLLDFLPFTCDGCKLVFCLEHRSYKSHDCPKSDHGSRTVSICETCSIAIETTGFDKEGIKSLLQKHERSGDCDPNKKKKPMCPVKRCREILSFANNITCKDCGVKFCLKHRFPTDHVCNKKSIATNGGTSLRWNEKFMEALSLRNEKGCGRGSSVSSRSSPSVRSF